MQSLRCSYKGTQKAPATALLFLKNIPDNLHISVYVASNGWVHLFTFEAIFAVVYYCHFNLTKKWAKTKTFTQVVHSQVCDLCLTAKKYHWKLLQVNLHVKGQVISKSSKLPKPKATVMYRNQPWNCLFKRHSISCNWKLTPYLIGFLIRRLTVSV